MFGEMALCCLLVMAMTIAPLPVASRESAGKQTRPHIVMIVADDLGLSDVSFHSAGGQIPTPNLDALASDGVILGSHYAMPSCSPSRSALLTGIYPIKTGMQEYVFLTGRRHKVPSGVKLMPKYLKERGYKTHLIGKWHLGYYTDQCLPHNRGFDSHYGYYQGAGSYFDHKTTGGGSSGYDWWENGNADRSANGTYTTDLLTTRAKQIISEHAQESKQDPLFMLIMHMAPHGGLRGKLHEAPERWLDEPAIGHIEEQNRTKLAAMIMALDAAVGETVRSLSDAGLLENSVIVFTSDNGPTTASDPLFGTGASSWPLRGQKFTLWEGGVRVPAFVWSPLLKKKGYTNRNVIHFTDWLPTFYNLAGGNAAMLPDELDGFDIWPTLSDDKKSPRHTLLINYDTGGKQYYAVRWGRFKYIHGISPPFKLSANDTGVRFDNWYAAAGKAVHDLGELQDLTENSMAYQVISRVKGFRKPRRDWRQPIVQCRIDPQIASSPTGGDAKEFQIEEMVQATKKSNRRAKVCATPDQGCLFDIEEDPCEIHEYTGWNRALLIARIRQLALYYLRKTKPAISPWSQAFVGFENASLPENHNGVWAPYVPAERNIDDDSPPNRFGFFLNSNVVGF